MPIYFKRNLSEATTLIYMFSSEFSDMTMKSFMIIACHTNVNIGYKRQKKTQLDHCCRLIAKFFPHKIIHIRSGPRLKL